LAAALLVSDGVAAQAHSSSSSHTNQSSSEDSEEDTIVSHAQIARHFFFTDWKQKENTHTSTADDSSSIEARTLVRSHTTQ
jgi:hypothetical protein